MPSRAPSPDKVDPDLLALRHSTTAAIRSANLLTVRPDSAAKSNAADVRTESSDSSDLGTVRSPARNRCNGINDCHSKLDMLSGSAQAGLHLDPAEQHSASAGASTAHSAHLTAEASSRAPGINMSHTMPAAGSSSLTAVSPPCAQQQNFKKSAGPPMSDVGGVQSSLHNSASSLQSLCGSKHQQKQLHTQLTRPVQESDRSAVPADSSLCSSSGQSSEASSTAQESQDVQQASLDSQMERPDASAEPSAALKQHIADAAPLAASLRAARSATGPPLQMLSQLTHTEERRCPSLADQCASSANRSDSAPGSSGGSRSSSRVRAHHAESSTAASLPTSVEAESAPSSTQKESSLKQVGHGKSSIAPDSASSSASLLTAEVLSPATTVHQSMSAARGFDGAFATPPDDILDAAASSGEQGLRMSTDAQLLPNAAQLTPAQSATTTDDLGQPACLQQLSPDSQRHSSVLHLNAAGPAVQEGYANDNDDDSQSSICSTPSVESSHGQAEQRDGVQGYTTGETSAASRCEDTASSSVRAEAASNVESPQVQQQHVAHKAAPQQSSVSRFVTYMYGRCHSCTIARSH